MPSLTIKDIPEDVLARLRARAAAERRSMNKEVLHLLEIGLSGSVVEESARLRELARAQAEAWTRLGGRWQSDESTAAEIEAVYAARSQGRPIDL